ncbi:MAG: acyl-ACP--UDP-N-acetylglucosamine O-acyltransferase [Candidatus Omnitrophica bacterium]|nr:acyl-ACP--UDP-N-acetylglucosamine O-acyltransferase [Candidatus Omnitrophota bacterium]
MGIHKTAMVAKSAEIDPSAIIGPNVIIEDGVIVQAGTKIMANAYICKGTEISEGTAIHMGAVIGHEPQDYGYKGEETLTKIGKNCIIREYVTIHRGSGEGTSTVIGDNNFIMCQVHLGHNCVTEESVIIASGALLAGHVLVEKGVFISGGTAFHQFCRVGRYAMIGGFTGVNKDVPPYVIVRGPSMIGGVNIVGLTRAGFSKDQIQNIRKAYKILYREDLNTEDALIRIKEELPADEAVDHFVSFIQGSKRGICKYSYSRSVFFE